MASSSPQKKILIVDDDPLIVRMYERKLTKEGFAITLAANGEEGLKALEKETPDLVLLDVLMPKMNGWEALKKIKENPKTKNIPIITLTSLGDKPADIQKFKDAGVKEYLVKSEVDLKTLVATIWKHLS
ncbi:MAG: response regulator [bacterium]|nr:response regulator [bacterium]